MIKFRDWLLSQESSAFTRTRHAAALGTGPSIPDASINSRSTATPWESKQIQKRNKKKKKKKKKKKIDESINPAVDSWIEEIDSFKKDLESLFKILGQKEKQKIKNKSVSKKDSLTDKKDEPLSKDKDKKPSKEDTKQKPKPKPKQKESD